MTSRGDAFAHSDAIAPQTTYNKLSGHDVRHQGAPQVNNNILRAECHNSEVQTKMVHGSCTKVVTNIDRTNAPDNAAAMNCDNV